MEKDKVFRKEMTELSLLGVPVSGIGSLFPFL